MEEVSLIYDILEFVNLYEFVSNFLFENLEFGCLKISLFLIYEYIKSICLFDFFKMFEYLLFNVHEQIYNYS